MTEDVIDYKAPINSDDAKLLRSRIDQQSELICILKKRADEFLVKYNTKEEECAKLTAENEKITNLLADERKRADSFENCYLNLGKVHHNMEEAKKQIDLQLVELKRECEILNKENVQFLSKSETKDSLIIQLENSLSEKDREIKELKEKERESSGKFTATQELNDANILELKAKYHNEIDELNVEMTRVNKNYFDIAEELEAVRRREKELENQLSTVMNMYNAEKKRCIELEERLQRRPDRNHASEREALQRKIIDLEEQHSRALQNFNAYKGHTQDLLLQERSLNNQLRRLKSPDRMHRSDSVLTMKDSYSSGEGIA